MVGIIAFHVLMLALGIVIATRLVSLQAVGHLLGYLHKSIGITTPATEQVRTVALIWIGSLIVMVDGCLFLLLFITRMSS